MFFFFITATLYLRPRQIRSGWIPLIYKLKIAQSEQDVVDVKWFVAKIKKVWGGGDALVWCGRHWCVTMIWDFRLDQSASPGGWGREQGRRLKKKTLNLPSVPAADWRAVTFKHALCQQPCRYLPGICSRLNPENAEVVEATPSWTARVWGRFDVCSRAEHYILPWAV